MNINSILSPPLNKNTQRTYLLFTESSKVNPSFNHVPIFYYTILITNTVPHTNIFRRYLPHA